MHSKDVMLILLVICNGLLSFLLVYEKRQPSQSLQSRESLNHKSEIMVEAELPTHQCENVPIVDETPSPEFTVEDRLLEVVALQKAMLVPHKLPDGSGTVVRLEPDGIHVRSASGICKIGIRELPISLSDRYYIHADTAELYSSLFQQKLSHVQSLREEQAKAYHIASKKQQEADRANREREEKIRTEQQNARARALWSEYDNRYQEYLQRRREKENSRSWGRIVTMPKAPTPPKVPRPPMR